MEKDIIPTGEKSYGITFAIRLYKDARGIGYAKTFMKNAIEKYKETDEYKNNPEKGVWLVTNSDNLPAIKTYRHFGFKSATYEKEKGRVLMKVKKL